LGIPNDDRNKMIVLPTFQVATRSNSQKKMKLCSIMNPDTLECLWILVFPIGIIEVSTSRKWYFWLLFHFLTRLLTSKHLKLFSTYLVVWNGTMWKPCFSAPQNAKR